jgi:hypothetical protein
MEWSLIKQRDAFTIDTRVEQRMDRSDGSLSRPSVIPLHLPRAPPLRQHQLKTEEARDRGMGCRAEVKGKGKIVSVVN